MNSKSVGQQKDQRDSAVFSGELNALKNRIQKEYFVIQNEVKKFSKNFQGKTMQPDKMQNYCQYVGYLSNLQGTFVKNCSDYMTQKERVETASINQRLITDAISKIKSMRQTQLIYEKRFVKQAPLKQICHVCNSKIREMDVRAQKQQLANDAQMRKHMLKKIYEDMSKEDEDLYSRDQDQVFFKFLKLVLVKKQEVLAMQTNQANEFLMDVARSFQNMNFLSDYVPAANVYGDSSSAYFHRQLVKPYIKDVNFKFQNKAHEWTAKAIETIMESLKKKRQQNAVSYACQTQKQLNESAKHDKKNKYMDMSAQIKENSQLKQQVKSLTENMQLLKSQLAVIQKQKQKNAKYWNKQCQIMQKRIKDLQNQLKILEKLNFDANEKLQKIKRNTTTRTYKRISINGTQKQIDQKSKKTIAINDDEEEADEDFSKTQRMKSSNKRKIKVMNASSISNTFYRNNRQKMSFDYDQQMFSKSAICSKHNIDINADEDQNNGSIKIARHENSMKDSNRQNSQDLLLESSMNTSTQQFNRRTDQSLEGSRKLEKKNGAGKVDFMIDSKQNIRDKSKKNTLDVNYDRMYQQDEGRQQSDSLALVQDGLQGQRRQKSRSRSNKRANTVHRIVSIQQQVHSSSKKKIQKSGKEEDVNEVNSKSQRRIKNVITESKQNDNSNDSGGIKKPFSSSSRHNKQMGMDSPLKANQTQNSRIKNTPNKILRIKTDNSPQKIEQVEQMKSKLSEVNTKMQKSQKRIKYPLGQKTSTNKADQVSEATFYKNNNTKNISPLNKIQGQSLKKRSVHKEEKEVSKDQPLLKCDKSTQTIAATKIPLSMLASSMNKGGVINVTNTIRPDQPQSHPQVKQLLNQLHKTLVTQKLISQKTFQGDKFQHILLNVLNDKGVRILQKLNIKRSNSNKHSPSSSFSPLPSPLASPQGLSSISPSLSLSTSNRQSPIHSKHSPSNSQLHYQQKQSELTVALNIKNFSPLFGLGGGKCNNKTADGNKQNVEVGDMASASIKNGLKSLKSIKHLKAGKQKSKTIKNPIQHEQHAPNTSFILPKLSSVNKHHISNMSLDQGYGSRPHKTDRQKYRPHEHGMNLNESQMAHNSISNSQVQLDINLQQNKNNPNSINSFSNYSNRQSGHNRTKNYFIVTKCDVVGEQSQAKHHKLSRISKRKATQQQDESDKANQQQKLYYYIKKEKRLFNKIQSENESLQQISKVVKSSKDSYHPNNNHHQQIRQHQNRFSHPHHEQQYKELHGQKSLELLFMNELSAYQFEQQTKRPLLDNHNQSSKNHCLSQMSHPQPQQQHIRHHPYQQLNHSGANAVSSNNNIVCNISISNNPNSLNDDQQQLPLSLKKSISSTSPQKSNAIKLTSHQKQYINQLYSIFSLLKQKNLEAYQRTCSFITHPYQTVVNGFALINSLKEITLKAFFRYFSSIALLHRKCRKQEATTCCQHILLFAKSLDDLIKEQEGKQKQNKEGKQNSEKEKNEQENQKHIVSEFGKEKKNGEKQQKERKEQKDRVQKEKEKDRQKKQKENLQKKFQKEKTNQKNILPSLIMPTTNSSTSQTNESREKTEEHINIPSATQVTN